MLSIERCKNVLKAHNSNLNSDEIMQVRDYLYLLAALQLEMENNKEKEY